MRIAPLLALAAVLAAAATGRVVVAVALRRRHPRAAAAIDRWWAWSPLAVVAVTITALQPRLGIPLSVAMGWWLTRAGALGSPFRPRR